MKCEQCGIDTKISYLGTFSRTLCAACAPASNHDNKGRDHVARRAAHHSLSPDLSVPEGVGLEVLHVNPDSALKGLVTVGDKIVAYNETWVRSSDDLHSAKRRAKKHGTASMIILTNRGWDVLEFPPGPLGVNVVPSSRSWVEWFIDLHSYRQHQKKKSAPNWGSQNQERPAARPSKSLGSAIPESGTSNLMPTLTHVIALFTGIIGPALILGVSDDEQVKAHAREAFDWQLTFLIGVILSLLLFFLLIGIVTLAILVILDLVFSVAAAINASSGRHWSYPISIKVLSRPKEFFEMGETSSATISGEDTITIDSPVLTGEKRTLQVFRDGALDDLEFEIGGSGALYYFSDKLSKSELTDIKIGLEESYPNAEFALVKACDSADPFAAAKLGIRGEGRD